MTEKRDIKELIQQEETHLNNLLEPNDLNSFKGMVDELRDTWSKKQMFRTETEARFSVLQDNRYPTKAAKYWQCVREQSSYLDNLMALSFDSKLINISVPSEARYSLLTKIIWSLSLVLPLTSRQRKHWQVLPCFFNSVCKY